MRKKGTGESKPTYKTVKLEVNDRLRMLRGELKQSDFAQILGVHRNSVTRWELGEWLPTGAVLIKLHEILNIDLNWLRLGKG